MDTFFPFIAIGIFVLLAIGSMIWSSKAEKKRREALRQVADDMGLEYLEEGSHDLSLSLESMHESKLFNRGRARRFRSVIQGQTDDVSIYLFDYFFTTGSGKHSRTHRQTVACLQSPNLALPQFAMRPQGAIVDAIGKSLGGQDIDFESHPEFSRQFVLQGGDEMAIRENFSPTVLEFFEQHAGISVEGLGNGLFFYRHNRRMPPDGMRELLRQAYEVFAIFSRRVA